MLKGLESGGVSSEEQQRGHCDLVKRTEPDGGHRRLKALLFLLYCALGLSHFSRVLFGELLVALPLLWCLRLRLHEDQHYIHSAPVSYIPFWLCATWTYLDKLLELM